MEKILARYYVELEAHKGDSVSLTFEYREPFVLSVNGKPNAGGNSEIVAACQSPRLSQLVRIKAPRKKDPFERKDLFEIVLKAEDNGLVARGGQDSIVANWPDGHVRFTTATDPKNPWPVPATASEPPLTTSMLAPDPKGIEL